MNAGTRGCDRCGLTDTELGEAHVVAIEEYQRQQAVVDAFDAYWPKGGASGKPPFGLWVAVEALRAALNEGRKPKLRAVAEGGLA